ncbi:MAG: 4'-phosphopantetheinyl transferase superfamily protein, partial [Mucilaginibacter sp.]
MVDLWSIDKTRTNEPRFYSKIISAQEKELYRLSPDLHLPFDVFVWLAWSVKESVYKFLKRIEGENAPLLVFAPTKICLQEITAADNGCNGIVMFRSERLYYRTEVTDEWIHSVVN